MKVISFKSLFGEERAKFGSTQGLDEFAPDGFEKAVDSLRREMVSFPREYSMQNPHGMLEYVDDYDCHRVWVADGVLLGQFKNGGVCDTPPAKGSICNGNWYQLPNPAR